MADKALEVKMTADVSSLQAKSAVAKAELAQVNATVRKLATASLSASAEMKASLNPELQRAAGDAVRLRAEVSKLNTELRETVHPEVTGFFGKLHENVRVTGESIEHMHARLNVFSDTLGKFSELVMAGMGVEAITEQVNKVAELGESYAHLQEKFGGTTQDFAALKVAATETSTDFSMVGGGLRELGKNMQTALVTPTSTAAEAFQALGISVTDSSGHLRPTLAVYQQVSEKLAEMQDGTGKTALAGDLLGQRYGENLIPVLNLTGQNFDELKTKAQEFGFVLTNQDITAAEAFKEKQGDVRMALEGVEVQIMSASLPAMTALEGALVAAAKNGGALHDVAVGLGVALKVVAEGAVLVVSGVTEIVEVAYTAGEVLGGLIQISEAAGEAMVGDFKDAAGEAKMAIAGIGDDVSHLATRIKSQVNLDVGVATALWAPSTLKAPDVEAPKIAAPVIGDSALWMKSEDTALAQQNAKIMQGARTVAQANQEKLQNTVQFWQSALAAGKLNAEEELQARSALSKAEMALRQNQLSAGVSAAKSAANQQVQIARDAAQAQAQVAQSQYELKVANWAIEVDQGKMTKVQEVQAEIAAQAQIWQAKEAEMAREAQADRAMVVEHAKMLDDIQVATAQHNVAMAQLNEQLVQAQLADAKKVADANKQAADKTHQAWQQAFQPISQAFTTTLNGVMQGTETLQQAELKAAQNITLAFVDAAAKRLVSYVASEAQMLSAHVVTETAMTAATGAGETARLAAKATAATTGRAMDAADGTVRIGNAAYKSAAEAYSAVVGIPYVGPILAPAAAATAFAGVMAFDVLSAAGGTVIEAGVNPLAQLHEKEMVLPAYIAQPLMDMVTSNNTFNQSGGDTYSHTNNFNVNATGAGVDQHTILSALNNAVRGGEHTSGRYPALARAFRR